MYINEDTKISELIKFNVGSIEAIISISSIFSKLRIPILRKALASRVTIKQAAKIGGVTVMEFYEKLIPLGFLVSETKMKEDDNVKAVNSNGGFYIDLKPEEVIELDVRETLKEGKDPFNDIMEALKRLPDAFTLKIINSFEPAPLFNILTKKGYEYCVDEISASLVHTYFRKNLLVSSKPELITVSNENEDMQDVLKKYGSNVKKVDVRHLEMPLPMTTILKELETLPNETLLFVHHKKVPKFLFPELAERGYKWCIQEIEEGRVNLAIYR